VLRPPLTQLGARGAPEESGAAAAEGSRGPALRPIGRPLADAESQLGACLAARGRLAEAGPLLLAGYEALDRSRGPSHPKTMAACERLDAFRAAHNGGPVHSCRVRTPA